MKRFFLFLASLCILMTPLMTACESKKTKYTTYSFDLFDTVTTIIGYENSQEEFDRTSEEILHALHEYHRLFNIYEKDAEYVGLYDINQLVDGKHPIVEVDRRIIDMLLWAKEIYSLTDGTVNIAMGSVLSIWHTYREEGLQDPQKARLPSAEELDQASLHCAIENLLIDEKQGTVQLLDPEMTLDVGAIAKGYAVEMIARHLEESGRFGYLINVGGNVRAIGTKPNGESWNIGIENPQNEDTYLAYCALSGASLITSGSYQRYYTVDGKQYHHIIDPETNMPCDTFLSVSVITKDAANGDALSTALFCMTLQEGLALIEQTEDTEALWVFSDGTQKRSSGFDLISQSKK